MARRQRELDSGFYREDGYTKISLLEGKGFTPHPNLPPSRGKGLRGRGDQKVRPYGVYG